MDEKNITEEFPIKGKDIQSISFEKRENFPDAMKIYLKDGRVIELDLVIARVKVWKNETE